MEAIDSMKEKVSQEEEEEEWAADELGRPPKLADGSRDYSGLDYRKVFLRSYPLLWEKADMEIERVTIIKSLQRHLKKVLVKMFVIKKLRQKIAEYRGLLRSTHYH